MTRASSIAAVIALCLAVGCDTARSDPGRTYPPAVVYPGDPEFVGDWQGDVDGLGGALVIGRLGDMNYFGSFRSGDGNTEYVLLLAHSLARLEGGAEAPSNRMTFTWQDGRGSRGLGWLLIDRQDSALTGSFGYGNATTGLGDWAFVRGQDP